MRVLFKYHWVAFLVIFLIWIVLPVNAAYHTSNFYAANAADAGLSNTSNIDYFIARQGIGNLISDITSSGNFVSLKARTTVNQSDSIFRFGTSFNTSALPDDAIINDVNFYFYNASTSNALGEVSLAITAFMPSNPLLTVDDFNKTNSTRYAIDTPRTSLIEGMNSIPFNEIGKNAVSKVGTTSIMMRLSIDVDGTLDGITWLGGVESNFVFFQNDTTFESRKPYLSVNWSDGRPIHYYAYGDSITRANQGDLNPDGSDSYIIQLRDNHNASAGADHNTAPTAYTSTQGLENIAGNYSTENKIYVIELGVNDNGADPDGGVESWNDTAMNLKSMRDYVVANGSRALISMILLRNTANETNRIIGIQNNLTDNGVCYMKTWDALDSIPNNGILNNYSGTYFIDGVHPNKTGHYLMSEYIWGVLNGSIDEVCGYPPIPTPTPTPNPYTFCQNSTGNLSLYLQNSGPDWLEYFWNASANVSRVSIDSRLITDFDNATTSILIPDLAQGQNHTARIYNATDYGELVCFLNVPVTTTLIPMFPVTSNTPETLSGYWWVLVLLLLAVVVVFKKW